MESKIELITMGVVLDPSEVQTRFERRLVFNRSAVKKLKKDFEKFADDPDTGTKRIAALQDAASHIASPHERGITMAALHAAIDRPLRSKMYSAHEIYLQAEKRGAGRKITVRGWCGFKLTKKDYKLLKA